MSTIAADAAGKGRQLTFIQELLKQNALQEKGRWHPHASVHH